ncbi:sensor histidine kinase [Sporosarcina sp. Te-1]|uniref:ATP-binding protein n=1 Tax=Sporosarcina sp. Te-1 TaxID=2818390 RepID=UPI001A9ECDA1|nr:sensor histidine kinase [Sporosarcina sp. Te-1]QTD39499.1 sensor histidine kinase [Sporosarcina sp. Te-1]
MAKTSTVSACGRKRRFYNLHIKMILLISFLLICILIVLGIFLNQLVAKTNETQIGKRALTVASAVAGMDEVVEALERNDSVAIQAIVNPIQEATHAEYIVVGDNNSIRYSHPVEERVGEKMVGGDNDRALIQGESYISKQTGSLGPAIRGKVPIVNENGKIVGVVSVGFLNGNVEALINEEKSVIWFYISLVFVLGILGAICISSYVKRVLFHMEPEEISELLLQKEAILQSTKEGIVAVNQHGELTMLNKAASEMIAVNGQVDSTIYGQLFHRVQETELEWDKEMLLGDSVVLVNRMPIIENGEFAGAVATFRRKTDIEHLTKEFSQMKQYANTLRSQAHEFSNKLYTILGLIQLDKIEEAEAFIQQERDTQDQWLTFLADRVADPFVHGLLQGKHSQANEADITLTIQEDSQLAQPVEGQRQTALLTGVGNIVENAIESIKMSHPKRREISIYFTDGEEDIYFEIEDSGTGISPEEADRIFDQDYSTKSDYGRGTGLALTRKALREVGGEIMVEPSELGGALFILVIPKKEL